MAVNKIRKFTEDDLETVIGVWFRSCKSVYTFLPEWPDMTLDKAHQIFVEHIYPRCEFWVGRDEESIAGFLGMNGSYIDRLYIDPSHQRKGWGCAFMDYAKELQPKGLELHTHQENHGARALYEKCGFVAVKFGMSPAPENVPDIEYHWRPEP